MLRIGAEKFCVPLITKLENCVVWGLEKIQKYSLDPNMYTNQIPNANANKYWIIFKVFCIKQQTFSVRGFLSAHAYTSQTF